jgi:hypothetical protein
MGASIARAAFVLLATAVLFGAQLHAALRIEVLRPVGGLAPHVVGLFEEPIGFQQTTAGTYYVFDRRGHTVYAVDGAKTKARKLVEIGQELGRILQPRGFDAAADGSFVVADAPRGQERIQVFGPGGLPRSAFFLPGRPIPAVGTGTFILSGVASLQYTGEALLVSRPESGALFTEYSVLGQAVRSIGRLRDTGHERDAELHSAMNAGLPLADPTGGYYYVFLAGRPMFRKYDAKGALVFERHVEGRELDDYIASLPARWPSRRVDDREIPHVAPTVRSAAVNAQGELWIALTVPYTYVYDSRGDKTRIVQFTATGTFSPHSMSFTRAGRLLVTPGCYEFDPSR